MAKTQVDVILVPQGAEYRAVCRGLVACVGALPQVRAIPVGSEPVRRFLDQWHCTQGEGIESVLLMGVCGSLVPQCQVGDGVLYQCCWASLSRGRVRQSDRTLTEWIQTRLGAEVALVSGVSCDRIITTVAEKQQLAQQFPVAVVDMEGFTAFECLQQWQIRAAMVRVVSDQVDQPLPDLSPALSASGQMQPVPLALQLLRQPRRSLTLIQGSLRALQKLQHLTAQIFRPLQE
ncbi:hypothetical protein GS597_09400 [Synechococcales cyanobacterium C]|uniref:Nucleoside phosphorylase domain-containing protein n=1 Tax=Petrachloros mirabilis ULC683 TaxID=2781853 RepID=A0A8K1ZYY9_9CYAN|nr:hypothetical protein [Petrachloros mirabilis]NCJ06717.1 hypothetical protein [Petrachloros mirabilis ULC683]